jgi:uncharacterized protein YbaA (DUF1428 family)
MNYVDGFVAAVPTVNRDAYVRHAQTMAGYGGFQVVSQA